MLISFAAYFVVMNLGKGQNDWKYYLQLICLVLLLTEKIPEPKGDANGNALKSRKIQQYT